MIESLEKGLLVLDDVIEDVIGLLLALRHAQRHVIFIVKFLVVGVLYRLLDGLIAEVGEPPI